MVSTFFSYNRPHLTGRDKEFPAKIVQSPVVAAYVILGLARCPAGAEPPIRVPRISWLQGWKRLFRGYEPLPNHQRAMAVLALKKMVELARRTTRSGRAVSGRAVSLRILCDQLEHTRANLAHLEAEIERLLTDDPQVKGLQQIPEFGSKTVAVLRAELGDVQRFARTDEVHCLRGMDVEIKESGQWKGRAKLSKRGSGLLRRMLYQPPYVAFTWRVPLLALTIVVSSSGVSKKAPP